MTDLKFDTKKIRLDFPILERIIDGNRLIYLDNAATSQKPRVVIESLKDYYERYNSNIHRGLHTLSEEATEAFEAVRDKVQAFIGAASQKEIIFTRNATEAINLVAYSWGDNNIDAGDEIIISIMENHSNFVTWQELAKRKQAKLVFLPITEDGLINMDEARKLIGQKTKLLAITQMSNVLGTIPPIKELSSLAHKFGARVLVDGAQGVSHLPTSVAELDCDFLAFSMHKMLGPTGVGILWGKEAILDQMPPFLFGGDMISSVHKDRTKYNELPWKFEAGTPNVADVIASGVAIDYLSALGMDRVRAHEVELCRHALSRLSALDGVKIYGPKGIENRGGVISFSYRDIHPHDMGQILNESGIAIRAGHHCCQPLMNELKVMATARASFYIYNTTEEIDFLIDSMKEVERVLGHVLR
ncbi:MAG: cysteine desulfurase [Candidatus Obscuribacterales bacterium]|nr:cysteine desulfurase [Candidatus Obscuribacterales bacterium]